MNTLPPLPSLRCFEAVSRLGSVTLAAAELNVSHSAVSQRITLLEERLGLRLFTRESRGLHLNKDGRFYASQICAALSEIARATKLMEIRTLPVSTGMEVAYSQPAKDAPDKSSDRRQYA